MSDPEYAKGELEGVLPPLLGLRLIWHARELFSDVSIRRQFRDLATAVLTDCEDTSRSPALKLEALEGFVVRRQTLLKYIQQTEIEQMSEQGLLKQTLNESDEVIVVPRLPELLAAELASILGDELAKRLKRDLTNASSWLLDRTSMLPLGDVIGAQAVLDAANQAVSMPTKFFMDLLNEPPRRQDVHSGQRALLRVPSGLMVELTFDEDRSFVVNSQGQPPLRFEAEQDESLGDVYSNMEGWLLLSHLAGCSMLAVSDDGRVVGRIDPALLQIVGSCSIPLRRPNPSSIELGFMTHDLPDGTSLVCHKSGIVEPITWSIFEFLCREDKLAKQFVEEATKAELYPLLVRLDIGLYQVSKLSDSNKADWASQVRADSVEPALERCSPFENAEIH